MSENQSKMYTVWTAHHGQSGSIHVVDGDVLLIINDLTRQYLHPDTADSLATVFREAAHDARSQRHDGVVPAMTDEEVRAMNRTVNDLVRRVFALERAACTESEPDSEDAPMTPEEEWADVGLEGEWEHDGPPFEYWALRDEIEVNPPDADRAEWRVFGQHCDVYAPTLRDAVASARKSAPDHLRRYLYPRDEWRPFSPPETSCAAQEPEVDTDDEIAELCARLAEVEAERDRARDEERDRIVRFIDSQCMPALAWQITGGIARKLEQGKHREEA